MHRVVTLVLGGVLAGAAAPQNHTVFPSDHTGSGSNLTLPGDTYQTYDPLTFGIARQMVFYDRWDVRIPNGRRIQRIGFPAEPGWSSTGYPLLLKVVMGQSTLGVDAASATFASNFSTTPTTVFGNASGGAKVFALPNLGPPGIVDIVWLPLDAPFTFDATRSLVVDFQVEANQNGNAAFPYYLDSAVHASPQRSFGLACRTSSGLDPALTTQPSTVIGGNWDIYLTSGPATTTTALLVGLASREPGIPLDVLGMTGCSLSVDPLWAGTFTTDGSGSYWWSFPIPNNRALFGGHLYCQTLMRDVFANNFGWITSNGDEVHLGVHPQAALIQGPQGSAQATTGWVQPNYGLITIFEHN